MSCTDDRDEFREFVSRVEPRLRRALMAGYGPVNGRDATVDALSWAWEHWEHVRTMSNPAGYLYRVGSTSAQRRRPTARGDDLSLYAAPAAELGFEPALLPALHGLTRHQRSAVLLVHGYGWSFRDAAEILGVSLSTLRNHVDRALQKLRIALEVEHECFD